MVETIKFCATKKNLKRNFDGTIFVGKRSRKNQREL
jgi:hypothetical protein